jgi:TPR repeat protein
VELFTRLFGSGQFGKSYAVVIGIGDYDAVRKLDAPRNDAQRVRDFLVKDAGFDYVVTLTDADATKARITKLMETDLPDRIGPNDRFLFYFSGHGATRDLGSSSRGYLLLKNSHPGVWDEMIQMPDIKGWADNFGRARHVLFVLDACFSGLAAVQVKSADAKPVTLQRLSRPSSYILTAGVDKEESYAVGGASLFTQAFLATARGELDPPADGIVSLEDMIPKINRYMDDKSLELGGRIKMTPQLYKERVENNAGEFFFLIPERMQRRPIEPVPAPRGEQTKNAKQLPASAPVQDCDRLAQPPNMGSRYPPISGVAFEKVDGKVAEDACERAIREFPGEARFNAYLGIALERLNRLDEARVAYRQAADQGNAVAQNNLGDIYADGRGVARNYAEALKWYHRAADQGSAQAQYGIGVMYSFGFGVSKNYTEALKWYHLAADQGSAQAQNGIGVMYDLGFGVSENDTEAAKWYRLAADQGSHDGQVNLGGMYEIGVGVPQSYAEALKWYHLAADQGDAHAQNKLGFLYAYGQGVPQSYAEALKWFRLAADQWNADAQAKLGLMYENGQGVPPDYAEAVKWYRLAAGQGEGAAQYNLGVMYKEGKGVPQSDTEAVKWYRLAAEQGHVSAQTNLGIMYEHGGGVSQSNTEAVKWYRLAAQQGDEFAQNRLKSLGQTSP